MSTTSTHPADGDLKLPPGASADSGEGTVGLVITCDSRGIAETVLRENRMEFKAVPNPGGSQYEGIYNGDGIRVGQYHRQSPGCLPALSFYAIG